MKVTEGTIQRAIDKVDYIVRGTMTVCFIDLKNGFTVIGESACVDPAEFDEQVGRSLAYSRAFSKLWAFYGFALAERLSIPYIDDGAPLADTGRTDGSEKQTGTGTLIDAVTKSGLAEPLVSAYAPTALVVEKRSDDCFVVQVPPGSTLQLGDELAPTGSARSISVQKDTLAGRAAYGHSQHARPLQDNDTSVGATSRHAENDGAVPAFLRTDTQSAFEKSLASPRSGEIESRA